jgi:hypothetical protein
MAGRYAILYAMYGVSTCNSPAMLCNMPVGGKDGPYFLLYPSASVS